MKKLTVSEVSKLLDNLSQEKFERLMTFPTAKKMNILRALYKNQNDFTEYRKCFF